MYMDHGESTLRLAGSTFRSVSVGRTADELVSDGGWVGRVRRCCSLVGQVVHMAVDCAIDKRNFHMLMQLYCTCSVRIQSNIYQCLLTLSEQCQGIR